jgi:hypothetical protein
MIMARSEGSQFIAIQHNATNLDAQTIGLPAWTRWSKPPGNCDDAYGRFIHVERSPGEELDDDEAVR